MRAFFNKKPKEVREAFPAPVEKEDNRIHLVLFVASGYEEPPEGLTNTITESVRNVDIGNIIKTLHNSMNSIITLVFRD